MCLRCTVYTSDLGQLECLKVPLAWSSKIRREVVILAIVAEPQS